MEAESTVSDDFTPYTYRVFKTQDNEFMQASPRKVENITVTLRYSWWYFGIEISSGNLVLHHENIP